MALGSASMELEDLLADSGSSRGRQRGRAEKDDVAGGGNLK